MTGEIWDGWVIGCRKSEEEELAVVGLVGKTSRSRHFLCQYLHHAADDDTQLSGDPVIEFQVQEPFFNLMLCNGE